MRMTWSVSNAKVRIIDYLCDGETRPSSQIISACKIRWIPYTIALAHLVRLGIVEQNYYRGLGEPSTTYYMTPRWITEYHRVVRDVTNGK